MTQSINNILRTTSIALTALTICAVSAFIPAVARAADAPTGGGYDVYDYSYPSYDTYDYYTSPGYDVYDYSYPSTGGYDVYDYSYPSYTTNYSYSHPGFYTGGGYYYGGGFSYGPSHTTGGGSQTQTQTQTQDQTTTVTNTNTNTVTVNVPATTAQPVNNYYNYSYSYPQPTCQSGWYGTYPNCYHYTPPVYNPPVAYNTPYVTLSQVPYTGLELGPVGTVVYWGFLILWCLLAAYLLVVKRAHRWVYRSMKKFLFGTTSTEQTVSGHVDLPAGKSTEVASPSLGKLPATAAQSLSAGIDPFIAAQIVRARRA